MSHRPVLAITLGDPAGCGPWIALRAACDARLRRVSRPLLVGDAWVLHRHVGGAGVRPLANIEDFDMRSRSVQVLHVPHPGIRRLALGAASRVGGESAALAIRTAVGLALQGRVAGIVTGPVAKGSFAAAGLPFAGHTEFLQALCGGGAVEMVMAAGRLKTVLITRHLALKDVPSALTVESVASAVSRVDRWARDRRLAPGKPRWALCGLNPHAGDKGILGREEIEVLAPAAAKLRRRGVDIQGPWPADTVWERHVKGEFDFVASLYHDQGMIPLKSAGAGAVVNVTAGLPIVRTSPGHGTAFDLASRGGFGRADPEPTIAAALWALRLAGEPRG